MVNSNKHSLMRSRINTFLHRTARTALMVVIGLVAVPDLATGQVTPSSPQLNVVDDSTKNNLEVDQRDPFLRGGNLKRGIIAPVVLIGAGFLAIENGFYDRFDARYDIRTKPFPNFNTDVDDYLFFAPAVGLAAFDIFSSQNKHDVRRQMGLLAASGALSSAIVWPTKFLVNETRPNGKPHAFPSGHATYAFVVATMVSREFRGKSKWIGIGSYTIASATGVMRILNDAHWLSDVLAGAGVGILSTNLVYVAHDRWFKNKGLNTLLMPTLLPNGSLGLGMIISLE